MEIARASPRWTARQLRDIENCRVYLRVTTISEITQGDGIHLQPGAWKCTAVDSKPTMLWPIQGRPGNIAIRSWTFFLSSLCNVNTKKLHAPLGAWTNLSDREWESMYNPNTGLVYRKINGKWYSYQILHKKRLCWDIEPGFHERDTQLPDLAMPISMIFYEHIIQMDLPTSIVTKDPILNIRATTWDAFIAQHNPWERDILRVNTDTSFTSFTIDADEELTRTLFISLWKRGTLHIVSDGGALAPVRGSFGWVIATEKKVLWTGEGLARGLPMDSHRS